MAKVSVSIRPLKGQAFDVEVEAEATVLDLKKAVEKANVEFQVDLQKLIYQGKILTDDASVQSISLKSGDFIVVMLAKAKPPPSSTASAAPAAAMAAADAGAAPAGTAPPVSMETASSTLVTGAAAEQTVQQLCDMGFPQEQVIRCLQAAFGNPDRAVEYLMSGIPAGLLAAPAGAPGGDAAPAPPAAAGGAAPPAGAGNAFPAMTAATGGGGGGGGGDMAAFDELRNNPRFAELAMMVAQNPQMLAQILPALAQTSPHLVQAIRANPEAFMRMLQETAGGGAEQDPVAAMLAAAGGGGGAGGGAGGQHVVRLTPEEGAAVQRLVDLGFDRNMAAQAYVACDKNEELAANFLFENQMMDD